MTPEVGSKTTEAQWISFMKRTISSPQAIFLKSCIAQEENLEGSRNKTLLSHKLLTSFISRSHYHYAYCPDMVQRIDISFSRVPILTTEKRNPRGLAAIAFIMPSCTSDESKSLTVLGKNS